MQNNYVIGIQTFVKLDTLQKLVDSLFQCYGIEKYTIIFFIDSTNNFLYSNRSDWIEQNKEVQEYLNKLSISKHNILLYNSIYNMGPYKGCKTLIDICMNYSDYIIFLEDDVILAKDALDYYEKIYNQYLINDDYACIDAVCSSSYKQYVTKTDEDNLHQKITHIQTFNWLHSYEFAITNKSWQKYRDIRGSAKGDVLVGYEFRKLNRYTILPIIGRSCRMGYNHKSGFSTYHNHVLEIPDNICYIPESNFISQSITSYNLLNNPC